MKKNGFISTTIVYSLLIVYLFLILSILVSYSQRNRFTDILKERVNEAVKINNFNVIFESRCWRKHEK